LVFDYKAYWEERGKTYSGEYWKVAYLNQAKGLKPTLKGLNGIGKVLDVGCGFGRLTKKLAMVYRRAEILGIDISPKLLEDAKAYLRNYSNANVALMDFLKYSPKARFDLIAEWACFCHIPPELIHKTVERCYSLLRKKGGYVLIIDIPEGTTMGTAAPTPYQWPYDYMTLFGDNFTLVKQLRNYVYKQDLYLFKKEE
jgi:SAM-dependent methyltransferase